MIAQELEAFEDPQLTPASLNEVAQTLRERLDRQHAWLAPSRLAVAASLPVERVLDGLTRLETAGFARLRRDRRTGIITQAHSRLHDPVETTWHVRSASQ